MRHAALIAVALMAGTALPSTAEPARRFNLATANA